MEDYFKKEKEFKKNHKVKYFLRELYYNCTYRLWYKITNIKDEIKWAWQRVFTGYDVTASWGLDNYLTDIALPVLKGYRSGDNKSGIPSMVCRKNESLKKSQKRWNGILDKMILSFEHIKKDVLIPGKKVEKEIQDGLKLFAKYFRTLWD